jgi:hypothetical protein
MFVVFILSRHRDFNNILEDDKDEGVFNEIIL